MNREDESDRKRRDEQSVNRRFYLPRLNRAAYQGRAVVHWTLTLESPGTGWLGSEILGAFRELMLHTAAREGLCCPAYCLMPDHIHLVWMGLRPTTDQRNAMAFLRTQLKRLIAPARFQRQAHDHVLRPGERRQGGLCRRVLV
jgi:putative transposase